MRASIYGNIRIPNDEINTIFAAEVMKDYYKILGVNPSADPQEIKKAYRSLAFRYHPDKNPDNSLSEAQFKEIQEAYAVVSDTAKRAKYDDERWLMGMGRKTQYQEAVTPTWLKNICIELNSSLATMDTYRMSQHALQAYILLILSDAHLGVLQQYADATTNNHIVTEIVKATKRLEVKYLDEITARLTTIASSDSNVSDAINSYVSERKRDARQEQLLPFVVILITIGLCLLMYVYAGWK